MTTDPFVTADWLREHPEALVFDCRHYYDGRVGRDEYVAGHIAGAQFVSLDDDLSGPASPKFGGASPLPEPSAFSKRAQQLGISDGSTVVAYDDAGGYIAGRFWWMLDSIGVEAYVLAGGIAASTEPLASGPQVDSGGGSLVVTTWPEHRFVSADEVAARGDEVVLLDARGEIPFRGDPEADGPRTGHLPGALNARAVDNLRDLQPLSDEELRSRFASFDVTDSTEVIAYCGAGVSAGLNLLGLRRAGNTNVRLYVGSFSEWGSDSEREVENGP
jgi:thiosulfate/3-mercaptopyruvate sulfurtransferase